METQTGEALTATLDRFHVGVSADWQACGTLTVTFAEFQLGPTDSYMEGALVDDSGQIVGIRMRPEVARQLTRAMLMTAPAALSC